MSTLIQTDTGASAVTGIRWERIDGPHTKTNGFLQVRCFVGKTIYLHGVANNNIMLEQIDQYARLTYNGIDLVCNIIVHENRLTIAITPTMSGIATLKDGCIPGLSMSISPIQFIFCAFEAPSISDYCYVEDGEFISYAPSLAAQALDGSIIPDVTELDAVQRVKYGIYQYRFVDEQPTGLFKKGEIMNTVDDVNGVYTSTQRYVALTREEVLASVRESLKAKRQAILYRGIYYYDEALLEMYPENPGYYVNADSGTQATLSNMFSLYASGMIPEGQETSYKVENDRGLYLAVKSLDDVKLLATITSGFVAAAFSVEEAASISLDKLTTEEVAAFDVDAAFATFEAATALTTTKPESQTIVLPPLKVDQIIPPVDQDTDEEETVDPDSPTSEIPPKTDPVVPDETVPGSDTSEGKEEQAVVGEVETSTDPEEPTEEEPQAK